MNALEEMTAAIDPSLRPYAVDAAGPARFEGPRAFSLEAVYEGFLLHFGHPRAFTGMDPDLRLLAGDTLFPGRQREIEHGTQARGVQA